MCFDSKSLEPNIPLHKISVFTQYTELGNKPKFFARYGNSQDFSITIKKNQNIALASFLLPTSRKVIEKCQDETIQFIDSIVNPKLFTYEHQRHPID